MFSQWATKRVCKFFMKRLLGRVLRSELDLEQLEVQLGSGRIQLRDLALNTEYINDQLGDSSIILKEGSVGSVRAKIPWKVLTAEPCEIEVDELELVFVPASNLGADKESCATFASSELNYGDLRQSSAPDVDPGGQGTGGGAYLGVDDGVRMIAKMVERVLLGLRVRVTNLICVFQSEGVGGSDLNEGDISRQSSYQGMLVVRVAYAEYGIEAPGDHDEKLRRVPCGTEPSMLVKVVNFRGATVEVMSLETEQCESFLGGHSVDFGGVQGYSVPIATGDDGGLAGTIQLSMPWKDGVVDVPKVNVDLVVNQVKLKGSTREIQQLLSLVHKYRSLGAGSGSMTSRIASQSTVSVAESAFAGRSSSMLAEKQRDLARLTLKTTASKVDIPLDENPSNVPFLPVGKFISDWMQWAGSDSPKKETYLAEADLAASVDEFFECFDGTWSSHASSTASGLWNWTRSAFTVITATSSLASGSVALSPGLGREVEYSVKVRVAGVSTALVYGQHKTSQSAGATEKGSHLDAHKCKEKNLAAFSNDLVEEYLAVDLAECHLSVAVSERQTNLRFTVDALEITEVINDIPPELDMGFYRLKCIEDVLPPYAVSFLSVETSGRASGSCTSGKDTFPEGGKRKLLLRILPSEASAARIAVNVQYPVGMNGGQSFSRTEVKAYFEPIVLVLDARSLRRINALVEEVQAPTCNSQGRGGIHAQVPGKRKSVGPSVDQMLLDVDGVHGGGLEAGDCAATSHETAWNGILEASLFAPSLRVVICFPEPGLSQLSDNFVAVDMAMATGKAGVVQPLLSLKKNGSASHDADTLDLHFGDGVVYLIESGEENSLESSICNHESGCLPLKMDQIAIFSESSHDLNNATSDIHTNEGGSLKVKWVHRPQEGAWLAKRAWDAALSQQRRTEGSSVMGSSNSEFAAATTAEAGEEDNQHLREEIVACSSKIIRLGLSRIWINLSGSQHVLVSELFSSFMDVLSSEALPKGTTVGGDPLKPTLPTGGVHQSSWGSQTSILMACAHVDIVIRPLCDSLSRVGSQTSCAGSNWDVLTYEMDSLQVLLVANMGGRPDVSYFWIKHEECQISGSYPDAHLTRLTDDSNLLLFSCRHGALGRGDGGEGNALATGSAGISLTYMAWPGRDQLADLVVTGSMRGGTFVANSGRLDWLDVVVSFFSQSSDSPHKTMVDAAIEVGSSIEKGHGASDGQPGNHRLFHLFDLHDVAMAYEPGKEVLLSPGAKIGEVFGNAAGLESGNMPCGYDQTCSPVACVLAAAAVRISSTPNIDAHGDQYDIWLRDCALHVINTNMRKCTQEYSLESMADTGYMQIAKAARLELTVRTECEQGLSWAVDCFDNQVRLDTCNDTTAAFSQLIVQLQQLFAPELQQSNFHWRSEERNKSDFDKNRVEKADVCIESESGLGSYEKSCKMSDSQEANVLELLKAVLDIPRPKDGASNYVAGTDDDVGSNSYEGSSRSCSSASFEDRQPSSERQDVECSFGSGLASSLSPPNKQKGLQLQDKLPDLHHPHLRDQGLPMFIEDYYVSEESSTDGTRGQFTSVGGQETETRAGWYDGKVFNVLDNYIPELKLGDNESLKQRNRASSSHDETRRKKVALPNKYPQSVGRLVLRNFSIRWRLYGGSDWPAGKQQKSGSLKPNKGGRQLGLCLEVILNDMDLQYDSFPAIGEYASRLVVAIRDVGVYDCSIDAPWRMVLGYHRSSSRPRESSSRAVKVEMDAVRPEPANPLEEYRLSLALLPIRLHLDQRHIDFCTEFFSPQSIEERGQFGQPGNSTRSSGSEALEDAFLPFFQLCEVKPITIRVDYLPRRVDLSAIRAGNYAELLNLVSWKGIGLHLKHVRSAGVQGWSSLVGIIFGEWLEDISQNQVYKFVQGVGPIRPLCAVGAGAAKLLVFPAEHYRKDRHLLRGMRKGAVAFLRSVSLEALGLGAQLAAGAHDLLYHTELALGGNRATVCSTETGDFSRKSKQPGDTREGIQQACESISRGLERSASSLLSNPMKVYQRGAGAGVAVASALRAAPAAAVAPAAAAVGAVRCALLGVRNGLDPEHKRESDEKHAGPPFMFQ